MAHPIVYIDSSRIREGKLDELQQAMTHLAAFVEVNMPRLISYGFFLDESQTQMTVVAVHPDSKSLAVHMDVGGSEFRKFVELIELLKIEVYGQVTEGVIERLHRKAQMLGSATVSVHRLYTGFSR